LTLMGYIKVMRPPLTVLGLLASLALVLWSGKPLLYEGLLIILAISLGNTGYTMMNEVVDVDVDAKNKPWKPLPSGQAGHVIHFNRSILLYDNNPNDMLRIVLLGRNSGVSVFPRI